MCGRFYIDDETAREIAKIARRIDQKMAKLGDIQFKKRGKHYVKEAKQLQKNRPVNSFRAPKEINVLCMDCNEQFIVVA